MPIGDPLVKGTATKDNIPLLEVKVSHFAHLGLGLALGAGLGLGIFFDLSMWAALSRKTNRDQTRLATESSNPVSDFMCGQYSCVSHPAKGARVLAGSTLSLII